MNSCLGKSITEGVGKDSMQPLNAMPLVPSSLKRPIRSDLLVITQPKAWLKSDEMSYYSTPGVFTVTVSGHEHQVYRERREKKPIESEAWRRRALDPAGRGAPSPPSIWTLSTAPSATIPSNPPSSRYVRTVLPIHFCFKRFYAHRSTYSHMMQCTVGHVICSSCHGKLADTSRCHMCNRDGGYRRCVAVDHILYAITVPCPNAAHGCAARTPYHDSHGHAAGCPTRRASAPSPAAASPPAPPPRCSPTSPARTAGRPP